MLAALNTLTIPFKLAAWLSVSRTG